MCAEKEPERCHRFLLIAPVLEEAGVRVVHVRGDGTLQDHAVLAGSSRGKIQVDLSGEPVDSARKKIPLTDYDKDVPGPAQVFPISKSVRQTTQNGNNGRRLYVDIFQWKRARYEPKAPCSGISGQKIHHTIDSETYHTIQHRTRTPAEQRGRIGA